MIEKYKQLFFLNVTVDDDIVLMSFFNFNSFKNRETCKGYFIPFEDFNVKKMCTYQNGILDPHSREGPIKS